MAAAVLGIPLKSIRMVPDDSGKMGVTPTESQALPWRGPRPDTRPDEIPEPEWLVLAACNEEWEAWKRKDHERYAVFYLAGKSAQVRYSPDTVQQGDAKFDYSIVEWFLSGYQIPIVEVETAAQELIDGHWASVEAVAEQLMKRDELSPLEVEDIVIGGRQQAT